MSGYSSGPRTDGLPDVVLSPAYVWLLPHVRGLLAAERAICLH